MLGAPAPLAGFDPSTTGRFSGVHRGLKIDWTFYCRQCDGMASTRTCPHADEHRLILSGTRLRKLLSENEEVPDHFSRPEALAVLKRYYAELDEKVDVKMHKYAGG